jgi:hypothetical protein
MFLLVLKSLLFGAYNLFYWEKPIVLVKPHLGVSYRHPKESTFSSCFSIETHGFRVPPWEISIWFLSHERNPLLIGHHRGLHYRVYWEFHGSARW